MSLYKLSSVSSTPGSDGRRRDTYRSLPVFLGFLWDLWSTQCRPDVSQYYFGFDFVDSILNLDRLPLWRRAGRYDRQLWTVKGSFASQKGN